MQTTSSILVQNCWDDLLPNHPAVICDYFGFQNEEHMTTIFGVYQGLVKYRGVTAKDLHMALKKKQLTKFIHDKYKGESSGYYTEFCKHNITLGTTL
jgi:hypothetical protein